MLFSKKLAKFKKIKHGFFNRRGGKSEGVYKSLNCGLGSRDKKKNVKKNLDIVKSKFGKNIKDIFLVSQFHSNKFIFIDKNFKKRRSRIKADAIITDQNKQPIGVLTADCVPILIFDNKKNIISSIHAGWKGAYKGIINNVINFMLKKGCRPENMTAAIGPSISHKSYNVKQNFRRKFIFKNPKNKIFFKEKKDNIYFNLPLYVKFQLKIKKIRNIDMLNIDTFDKKNNFFSARRSLKLRHADYGRNISIIMIN